MEQRYFSALLAITLLAILLLNSVSVLASNIPVAASLTEIKIDSTLDQPTALTRADDGSLYVLDGANHRIVVIPKSGKQWSFGEKQLQAPIGLTIWEQQLVVADTGKHRLVLFDLTGKLVKVIALDKLPPLSRASTKKNSEKTSAKTQQQLLAAEPIAITIQDEFAWWSDRANHRVCKTKLSNATTTLCFGRKGFINAEFDYPFQIAIDRDGYLAVVDTLNARVQHFHRNTSFINQSGRFGIRPGDLYRPNGVAIDQHDHVFVSDAYLGTISIFKSGKFLHYLSDQQGKPLKFETPSYLLLLEQQLYVVETAASRIMQVSLTNAEINLPDYDFMADNSQKNCVMCHLSWSKAYSAELGDEVPPVASEAMCYSCHHGVIIDSRKQIRHGGQHPSINDSNQRRAKLLKTYSKQERLDEMPEEIPVTKDKELLCTSCHTPHRQERTGDVVYEGHKNSWMRVANQGGDLCEGCHESHAEQSRELKVQLRGKNHPVAMKLSKPAHKGNKHHSTDPFLQKGLPKLLSAHGATLGKEQEMICQSCHQVHGGSDRDLVAVTAEDGALCKTCHQRQHTKSKKAAHKKGVHPVNTKLEEPVTHLGVKTKRVTCDSCHQVHSGLQGSPLLPAQLQQAEQLCENCHQRQHSKDQKDARKKGVHPINIKMDEEELQLLGLDKPVKINNVQIDTVKCASCHNIHAGNPGTALLPKGIKNAEQLCENCHPRQHAEDKDDALKKGIHPINVKLDEPVTINEQEIKTVGCLSCHAVHEGVKNTPAMLEDHRDGTLCEHCHEGKAAVVGTDHDLRISADESKNQQDELPKQSGVCGSCHSLHRADTKLLRLYSASKVTTSQADHPDRDPILLKNDEMCLNCHQKKGIAEESAIDAFAHPYKNVLLRSNQNVMPLLDEHEEIAKNGMIACITCHEPHTWEPKQKDAPLKQHFNFKEDQQGTVLNSFLRRKGVKETFCIDCHGMNALVKYKYYHDNSVVKETNIDYFE